MTRPANEKRVYVGALIAVVAAAVAALFTSKEIETTLLMVSAVISGLICFDTSMERRLRSAAPWMLVSLAPVVKTVPIVWFELNADNGLLVERYDHVGSLLFGALLLAAVYLVSRPAASTGSEGSRFDAVVVLGAASTSAVAGASVGFLFDRDFGSIQAARLIETPTWFVLGGLLAASALAISRANSPSLALTGLLANGAAAAGLLAFTVAGRSIDRGWWALLFAGLAMSAGGLGPGVLGDRASRDRRSYASVTVALIVGFVAAAAAITARGNTGGWGPGWAILGALSIAMFALALASNPTTELEEADLTLFGDVGVDPTASSSLDLDEVRAEAEAKQRALQSLRTASLEPPPVPVPVSASVVVPDAERQEPMVLDSGVASAAAGAPPSTLDTRPPEVAATQSAQAQFTSATESIAADQVDSDDVAPAAAVLPAAATDTSDEIASHPTTQPGWSDSNLVAAAQAAAEVRRAPVEQRHAMAPLESAHHFDPSTGLLSAAGLQHGLAAAFATPRDAGHVTIMMFMIRDLEEIERTYGRLASAAVTREVAERIRALLPAGTGARFARSAYAVVFLGDLGDSTKTAQRLARVLLQLRAPVDGRAVGDKIDVVAGMAQCYQNEDATKFVHRANQGLARAVQTVEPTLVAMP